MPKLLVPVLVAALLAGLAVAASAATTVRVGDNWFVRKQGVPTVTVARGTTVKWRFVGDAPHNVTVRRGPVRFKSASKSSGSYSRKLTRRGTYLIYCSIHGLEDQRMRLVVR